MNSLSIRRKAERLLPTTMGPLLDGVLSTVGGESKSLSVGPDCPSARMQVSDLQHPVSAPLM